MQITSNLMDYQTPTHVRKGHNEVKQLHTNCFLWLDLTSQMVSHISVERHRQS